MNTIKGVPISSGIAIGKVYLKKAVSEEITFTKAESKDEEKKRFQASRELAVKQVEEIYQEMLHSKGEQEASIFLAHIEMLNDTEFVKGVESVLEESGCTSEWAVKTVRDNFVKIFEAMDDEYMRERAMDIKDISGRVIRILKGDVNAGSLKLTEPSIMISDDLAPSDTAQMKPELVLGIINETGGPTSHAAIIARMLGIPFCICPRITSLVNNGQLLAFDGEEGNIELEVTEEILEDYREKQETFRQKKLRLEKLKGTKSITKDGYEVLLAGNIGAPEDADKVQQQDGQSIGLFRTEFLYMNREDSPTEEEQFAAYKETAEKMQGRPVVIRTLDIGGDKEVDYLRIPKEENPFLGYRAIRLCLDRVPFWKVQLRALLRASEFGNIHIMFPMIVSIEELVQAKQILEEVKGELRREGAAFNESVPVGMMMETPAAALMADVFAKEVDFFSIGTNDLIQYTMAVDRMNGKVAHLYSQYDPAVLRLVKKIVDSAHENGIWAGICGEAAADKALLPIWVGLGLDELSMSPVSILPIREQIQGLSKADCENLVKKIFLLRTGNEIEEALKHCR
ncbi:phosphotransferase system, enzyme I, PtsI [Anaerocolumna jejuensis DSM 15929]|uniref:Phosphoenolpyruvate-protein phosphotransferase n=1 Tax=Anaerocolumna jejuensis DSM 15929 TaxID=1121322 RepID=A0A1M6NUM1_9FIRM|nr:phosphoenolpyruvate--protein phosphotransferase [Anaerocolumna jejuensis]SHJ99318.1 phosphotransferase system, enzyme I, PtsI [Anaerocolumna jejuensis DSM 15929]